MSSGYLAVAWLNEHQSAATYQKLVRENDENATDMNRLKSTNDFWTLREPFVAFLAYEGFSEVTDSDIQYFSSDMRRVFLAYNKNKKSSYPPLLFFDSLLDGSNAYDHNINYFLSIVVKVTDDKIHEFLSSIQHEGMHLTQVGQLKDWISKGILKQQDGVADRFDVDQLTGSMLGINKGFSSVILAILSGCARSQKLTFSCLNKNGALTQPEFDYLVKEMRYNPFIQEFKVEGLNQSLSQLARAVGPSVARNRWLAANDYRPPLMADHWRVAARKWVEHLFNNPAILSLSHQTNMTQQFKTCVQEMGIEGLDALFGYLQQERSVIEGMLGQTKLPFYAACLPEQWHNYTKKFIDYLHKGDYFPFSQLGIGYSLANKSQLIELLIELNRLKKFEAVRLIDCLVPVKVNVQELTEYLLTLAGLAVKYEWTSLIVIEELTQPLADEQMRLLQNTYSHLNNIILHNRREQQGKEVVEEVAKELKQTELTPSRNESAPIIGTQKAKAFAPEKVKKLPNVEDNQSWHFQKSGGVQLQLELQHQQQVQQQQQVRQQTQQVHTDHVEVTLDELVSYDNIDQLLKNDYDELNKQPQGIDKNKIWMKNDDVERSELQAFFQTWISANPETQAPYVIRYMTKDAARHLLRHHLQHLRRHKSRLCYGLNSEDQLSKGLYTQRTKTGALVLCYNPELGYVKLNTPLTLDLTTPEPEAVVWRGDFRQFNFDYYSRLSESPLTEQEFSLMGVFAALQPLIKECEIEPQIAEFMRNHPDLKETIRLNQQKIIQHWSVFYQAWQYLGTEGIESFLAQENLPESNPKNAFELLFNDEPQVLQQIEQLGFDAQHYRALGQLYYALGKSSVPVFLRQLIYLQNKLGNEFFLAFKEAFLTPCENFLALCSQPCFAELNTLCEKLSEPDNKELLSLWLIISKIHAEAVGFESPDVLWKGFWYFVQALEQEGVRPPAILELPEVNTLVWMDRVLVCVKSISEQAQKKLFLRRITDYDLNHGGLPYALQYDGLKYFDEKLKLSDFYAGNPTYAPSLANLFSWNQDQLQLLTWRTLATQNFSLSQYELLCTYFNNCEHMRYLLIILLLTTRETTDQPIEQILDNLNQVFWLRKIAIRLHQSVYVLHQDQPAISLNALSVLSQLSQKGNKLSKNISSFLNIYKITYPENIILFFEGATILYQRTLLTGHTVQLIQLMELINQLNFAYYSTTLLAPSIKLAALFGQYDASVIRELISSVTLQPAAQEAISLLMTQLLSVDWQQSNLKVLTYYSNWVDFLDCINKIKKKLADTDTPRLEFLDSLSKQGLVFQYNRQGDIRAIAEPDHDALSNKLGIFVDHQERLWQFLHKHITISNQKPVAESVESLFIWLKQLQLKRGYLNEIEPLLQRYLPQKQGIIGTLIIYMVF